MTATDRKRKEREALLLLIGLLDDRLTGLLRDFMRAGRPWSMLRRVGATLTALHTQAALLGVSAATAAGGTASAGLAETIGRRVAESQDEFLRHFAEDVQAGRYRPKSRSGEGADALKRRIGLYAQRLRGTVNEAWLKSLPSGTKVIWTLGIAEHCDDCLEEAAYQWRWPWELTRVPGDGSTQCVTNCKCRLVADIPGVARVAPF